MRVKGIMPLFDKEDLNRWFKIFTDRAEEKMYVLLQAAGEMFVKYARESGVYIDHTGNLRSSIGYVIVKGGNVWAENFKREDVGTDGSEGLMKSKKLARELAKAYTGGWTLIGVAGMEYAVYVEAIESKDVITGAQIRTIDWMRKAIETTIAKAERRGRF